MFREPLEDIRESVYRDLETFVWGHLFSLVDDRKPSRSSDAALVHILLAYDPKFVEQLVNSSGISAAELQIMIDQAVVKFAECLLLLVQHAFIKEPLRLDSIRELTFVLEEVCNFLREREADFRFSLKAEKAEQELPQFLVTDPLYLETLFLDVIGEIVTSAAILTDERIEELAKDCISEEMAQFKDAVLRINAYAKTFLEGGVTGDELTEILLNYLQERILKTER